ncbi:class I SAM-dependent methyltransferase [Prosthecobacter sp.]|uniref:class I SAM-dependent methyltransferase n=1 Tax=Prosthecobacter sp. TaxID=1965333 RepID=UPI001D9CE8F0|nr:class I SAM-dependent methyltransferase [Prosthecobacter sp.]MCB1278599.1 class I SAM-dependent methyltransferase [Prosthecobacter sp.]
MQASEYNTLRAAEEHHWWYLVLRGLVSRALVGRLPPRGYILDAGCGTGGMLGFLQKGIRCLDVEGVDASELAVNHCQQRGLNMVKQAPVERMPFEDGEFDAVLSLDVLYHSGVDEEKALKEMSRVLGPGGLLVVNLPAFECLRGSHDLAVCGARRYRACQVRSLIEQHSLAVEMIHYWNAWLFSPLFVWRKLSRLGEKKESEVMSDLHQMPEWLNRMLTFAGLVDAWLCRVFHIPFGSSVFAVAHKVNPSTGGLDHGSK